MKVKRIRRALLARRMLFAAALFGTLLGTLAAPAYSAGNVWVTFYYDDSGTLVGAESWGDCSIGSRGRTTASSATQVYACDGEQPY
jgi:hypothetical protein